MTRLVTGLEDWKTMRVSPRRGRFRLSDLSVGNVRDHVMSVKTSAQGQLLIRTFLATNAGKKG